MQLQGGAFGDIGKFSKKKSQSRKKGRSLIVSTKVERGTLLLWNGFLFHVRGFGRVQNEVLSIYGENAQCTKSGLIVFN